MTGDRGVGLVIVMTVMLVMLGLTGFTIRLATTETAVAMNYRRSVELLYAAESALELAVRDLGRSRAWERWSRGFPMSSLWSTDPRVSMIDGLVVDLNQVTDELRRDLGDPPSSRGWRLVGHARLDAVMQRESWSEPYVVAVWLSEVPREADIGFRSDEPGPLVVYAAAFGAGRSRRAVHATVRRREQKWMEMTSWRVAR